ncbi:fimbrial-like protein [Escherichia whittamii]|uniref:Fimbrial-like protein n=1 Tax=Escherichia whittamii TaxID=2762229 RepID=A0ABR8TB32_9ESCH|nr:fimbrial-like protein [Escherichia whittamii]MBD7972924.1 fimbrial-like protein [Escherichia whittamii]MCA4890542.1 fimbrial-like protein [Escherichia whittamii]
MLKKNLLSAFTATVISGVAFNALADDPNQGSGKITFKGEVIDAPCSIAPGDEDQTINLGEVSKTVLNSGQKSLPVDVTIHLQDCILSDGTNTVDKVKITFSSASVDITDPSLLKNTLEGNIGSATGVGVRLVKTDNTSVTLGTPITMNFPTTNAYQELNFKARMESLAKNATSGNVQAQTNYVLNYK